MIVARGIALLLAAWVVAPRPVCAQISACADADLDGELTIFDAYTALRAAVGLNTCAACRCDVNTDGHVRITDVLRILRASAGSAVTMICPSCNIGTCGDGQLAPYDGAFVTGSVDLLTCEDLDADPNGAPSFEASVVKAFDRQLRRVDSAVQAEVSLNGCFCHGFTSSHAPERQDAQSVTTSSSTSSTSLDCSDCFYSVSLFTSVELAAVEVEVDFWNCFVTLVPGMRFEYGDDPFSVQLRLHGGVVEECDDGNQIDGDGCSAACTGESPDRCHFDAASSACEGGCASGECVAIGDARCGCTTDGLSPSRSTRDTQCLTRTRPFSVVEEASEARGRGVDGNEVIERSARR